MTTTKDPEIASLITDSPVAGLALADELATRLHAHLQSADDRLNRPGGTHYGQTPPVAVEAIASILFYAIATANHGWASSA